MQEILARNKIFAHPDRLEERIKTWSTKPITIEMDLTNRCNYNCPSCAWNRFYWNAELSLDNIINIIDQLKKFVRWIIFSWWWDPLMNKNIIKAIIYANSLWIDIWLITNWWLLHKYNMKDLVTYTKWIRVSINWVNDDDFTKKNWFWKEGYNQVRNNVTNLAKEKRKRNSDSIIGIGYLTEDNENYGNIKNFCEKAKNTWVDYIQFRPYHHTKTNIIKKLEKCREKIKDKYFDVLYTSEKYERRMFDYEIAFADEFRAVIAADWNMYPDCFTRWIKEFCFGNILRNTFDEIWNSNKRKNIIKNKIKQKNCPWQCRQEPLNQILWDIYKINKEWKHINFI